MVVVAFKAPFEGGCGWVSSFYLRGNDFDFMWFEVELLGLENDAFNSEYIRRVYVPQTYTNIT